MLLRFQLWRAVTGAAVAAVSLVATVAIGVFGALVLLVAPGYWDPPVGQIISDALGAGQVAYDLVGEWVLWQTVERLEAFASA